MRSVTVIILLALAKTAWAASTVGHEIASLGASKPAHRVFGGGLPARLDAVTCPLGSQWWPAHLAQSGGNARCRGGLPTGLSVVASQVSSASASASPYASPLPSLHVPPWCLLMLVRFGEFCFAGLWRHSGLQNAMFQATGPLTPALLGILGSKTSVF